MKNVNPKWARRGVGTLALCLMLLGILAPLAQAAILFQDDTFMTVDSDNIMIDANNSIPAGNKSIQFGNSATNGVLNWVQGTARFSLDHALDVTGGLTTDNVVDIGGTGGLAGNSPASSRNMLRKNASPNTAVTGAACSALGEVIVNTTANRLEVCTTLGAAGTAVWSAPTITLPQGSPNPITCSPGDLFYNTTTNTLNVCTGVNTWGIAGPQDFESVYAKDADKTLTTSGGNFTVATGAGNFGVTSTGSTSIGGNTIGLTSVAGTTINAGGTSSFSTSSGNLGLSSTAGNLNLTGGGAGAAAINLNSSNPAGGITGTWGTGGLNFSGPGSAVLNFNSTGAFNVAGTGASTVQTTSGDLSLKTNTSGNVALLATGVGKSITFADANVATPIKFSNTATALNGTFTAGDGILDALNEFTSTAVGAGASNVGTSGTFTNFTPATNDVQAALAAIDTKIGAGAANVEDLTFEPEYPDTVIYKDTLTPNNMGTLTSDYDSVTPEHFYKWTTTQAALQNIDLRFRYVLPPDFASTGNFTMRYRTQDATNTNDKVDVTVYNVTDAATCGSSLTNNGVAWTTATITTVALNAGCAGLSAGDILEIRIKLYSLKSGGTEHWAEVGKINHLYNN